MRVAVLLLFMLSCATALAAEPSVFELHYQGNFGNFSATATRSLTKATTEAGWLLHSHVGIELFGRELSSIKETSSFGWHDTQPLSRSYHFEQKGIGGRSRSLEFAANGESVAFTMGSRSGQLPLPDAALDPLNMTLALRSRIAAGNTDIELAVADRGELSIQHYRVVGEEMLQLPLGNFAAIHVERIRAANDDRSTHLWLARDADYLLLKLLQRERNGDDISLTLTTGLLANQPLTGSQGKAVSE